MATKIPFSKFKITKPAEGVNIIKILEQEVEVKQYLPAADKLTLIANVMNKSIDDNNFRNVYKEEIIGSLEIVFAYSNITFTDKQKEDIPKLYDMLKTHGIIDDILAAIPESEYNELVDAINDVSSAFYEYRTSALGILEQVSQDYSGLNLDAASIQEKIADPNNLTLLKDVMNKLG